MGPLRRESSEGLDSNLELMEDLELLPSRRDLLPEPSGIPQGGTRRAAWATLALAATLAALLLLHSPRGPASVLGKTALEAKDEQPAKPVEDDGVDRYVLSFWKTGCPNQAPSQGTQQWWRAHEREEVLTDMFVYCEAVAKGSATKEQEEVCCGVAEKCEPTCVKQVEWADVAPSSTNGAAAASQPATSAAESCHLATPGGGDDACYWAVANAMKNYKTSVDKYPGLTEDSSFEDFQGALWRMQLHGCPQPPPCEASAATVPAAGSPRVNDADEYNAKQQALAPRPEPELGLEPMAKASCLCVFDIDRTLTCKQRHAQNCSDVRVIEGAWDSAYGGGTLVLSQLAQNIPNTFCGKCYRGIVSAGDAAGPHSKEREVLLEMLGGTRWTLSDTWSRPAPHVESTLVVGAPDTFKQDSVKGMLEWMEKTKGVAIADDQVYMFDDNVLNPPPFAGTQYNARQVSCASRSPYRGEDLIGFCGGRAEELVEQPGVTSCNGPVARFTSTLPPPPPSTSSQAADA